MNKEYIPFHSKYRPQNFNNIIGQRKATTHLQSAIKKKTLTFSYLFIGQHGSGKTTLARVLAKALNCIDQKNNPCNLCENCLNIQFGKSFDVYEIDAGKNTGIEYIREMIEKIQFTPIMSQYKICIIDEAHMLSTNAFNSLLKTIESPPLNTIFILSTTTIHKIPNTIISRCQKVYLEPIKDQELTISLSKILHNEHIKITNQATVMLLNLAKGSFRDALNIIEFFSIERKIITVKEISSTYSIPSCQIINLLIEKICYSNSFDIILLINYIEFHKFNQESLFTSLYTTLIKKYINQDRIVFDKNNSKFNTKKLLMLLSYLLECKRTNKFKDFWISFISLMLKNSETQIKLSKVFQRKTLRSYKNKNQIYSN